MRVCWSLAVVMFLTDWCGAAERSVKVLPPEVSFPEPAALIATEAGSPGPDAKDCKVLASDKLGGLLRLPETVLVIDLWWKPETGRAVLMVGRLDVPADKVVEVRPEATLGLLRLKGDKLPRVAILALTAPGSDGPDGGQFRPVQTTQQRKADLIVPAGDYDVWVKAKNGGKAERIERKLRIQAGKIVVID